MLASQSPDYSSTSPGAGAEVFSADGAVTIKKGMGMISKGTAAAMTLAAPTAGTDDGIELTLISTTAAAHTITTPASGINKALHICTFAANIASAVTLRAYNGSWYMQSGVGATIS